MRAIVLGNLALDETFGVAAFPAPGASISARVLSTGLGGKGANQAIVLARALAALAPEAGQPRFVSVVGGDGRADILRELLAPEPLVADLHIRPELASDLSVILRDATGENVVITTQAAARALTPAEVARALAEARAGTVVLMQGNLSSDTTMAALEIARARGLLSVLNPSPIDAVTPAHLARADLVVVNEEEAAHFAQSLAAVPMVLRTLGRRGAEVWEQGRCLCAIAGTPVEAVDPTGAGDCFLGAALASMIARAARKLDEGDLRFAAQAASVTVTRLGTQAAFPTISEFAALAGRIGS